MLGCLQTFNQFDSKEEQMWYETTVSEKMPLSFRLSSMLLSSLILFLVWNLVQYIRNALRPGLKSVPGPFVARFSRLYRLWKISEGKAPNFYQSLHDQYGPIVRTAPQVVSISDPRSLATIYGINSKFVKVSLCCPDAMRHVKISLTFKV